LAERVAGLSIPAAEQAPASGTATDGFIVHEVMPTLCVRVVRAMPDLSPGLEREVEALWRAAAARVAAGGAGRLFNGLVFSADAITRGQITGHMTEFRRIVAQMENPELFAALGIRSLAVCGALCCADGVVIGRRPAAAVYQPGMWQLPPAGSVDGGALCADDTLDVHGQVLAELAEEVGLGRGDVGEPVPLCVVEHPGSHVCDLGLALQTGLDTGAVLAAHRAAPSGAEYDPLLIVPFDEVETFVARVGESLVPPAREFLARLGLVKAAERRMVSSG
jgi:hypothetical protein